MKNIQKISFLLMLIFLTAAGCKKDPVMYNKGIASFTLVEKNTAGVVLKEYPGTITNDEILVSLPIEVDVTKLTVDFKTENPRTIVQVGNEVQEPGLTEQDFSQPLAFRIKAEDKSTRTYLVRVEKKIALESFGFYKADNPVLQDDYKGIIRGMKIEIPVPESIDLTKLVARFKTTTGASLKIGATDQQSQISVNDFSNPIEYLFSDPALPVAEPIKFTASISFIGPKWWIIGESNIIVPTTSDLKMAINPITKYPYLVYYRSGKDEQGTAIATENRKVAVISYTGSDWTYLGASTGISDARAVSTQIAFDDEGNPYVGYNDYSDSQQKGTVLKYENNAWKPVGTKYFTPMKVDKFSFTIGENSQPIVAVSTGTAITGYARRAIYVSGFSTGQWINMTPAITNPLIGAVSPFRGLDGKSYLAVLDRNTNLSMYKLVNGVWTAVGPTGFRAADNLPPYTSVIGAASANGDVYIGYQTVVSSRRLNRILKFNKVSATWEELGSAGDSQSEDEKYALAIDPSGKLYFAFANNSGLYFRTFNEATNNWNTQRLVVSGKINGFDLQISSSAIPYVAVSTASDNKTTVYKYTTTK